MVKLSSIEESKIYIKNKIHKRIIGEERCEEMISVQKLIALVKKCMYSEDKDDKALGEKYLEELNNILCDLMFEVSCVEKSIDCMIIEKEQKNEEDKKKGKDLEERKTVFTIVK